MNNNQNHTRPLSLFDVLVDEYEHQVKTHGLKPLYPGGDKAAREQAAAKYAPLMDAKEREQRVNEELVTDFYRRLHQSGEKRAALCFSGGGIRSATFGLGVLQGLAERMQLNSFHFLSTVSGGGYLGSWFSAWVHRRGMKEVQTELEEDRPNQSPINPEPEPLFHLRRYSNYMSPKFGLLSADTWALVGIYLRNLFLNWMVLIPLMLAALALPRLWMSVLGWDAPDPVVVNRVFWLGFALGVISICYIIVNRPSLTDLTRRWFPPKLRSESWFLVFGLGCLVATAIAGSLYWSWVHTPHPNAPWLSLFGFELQQYFKQQEPWGFMAFGVALHFLGFALSQFFAPQIIKLKFYFGVRDFIYSILTGALGGLCLWVVTLAFSHPALAHPGRQAAIYACLAPPLFLLMFLVAATVFVGLASYYMNDADREWVARAGGWILIAIVVWVTVSGLVIFGPVGLIWLWKEFQMSLLSVGTGSGLITLLGGRSGKTAAKKGEESQTKKPGLPVKALELALPFAAIIFLLIIVAALSLATTALTGWIYNALAQGGMATSLHNAWGWTVQHVPLLSNITNLLSPLPEWLGKTFDPAYWKKMEAIPPAPKDALWQWHLNVLYYAPSRLMIFIALVFLAVGVIMGLFVNVNKFSLHSAYRDRLIRAYLGASRNLNERRPNPFTGMDEQDNLQMHDLIRPVFQPDSFIKMDELVGEIAKRQSPYARFIWSKISQQTQRLLLSYMVHKTAVLAKDARRALTNDFNRIIHGKPLHKERVFKKLSEQPEIQKVINRQPEVPLLTADSLPRWLQFWRPAAVEKLRINCMLLDAAFPGLLASVPEELNEARPLHVVNMALNLVKGEELAWQNRKAQSFTASPLHAGSLFEVGYRRSKEYAISQMQDGALTLGTSVAISGAAASPNMGYHSSPVVTFLLALFNVRLGWWLGNPGKAGANTYSQPGPVFAPGPLVAETLGLTDNDHPYVYLSDGGHFENLGLYEMVLRRCHLIVVSDGSQDKGFDFESLGNAVSKIRTDLGINITFSSIPISPRKDEIPTYIKDRDLGQEKKYCAVGRIHYSDVDEGDPQEIDGFLLYIKPAIYGVEPADVYNYARANPAFPHESTGDQMYSETQFESYRALGLYEIARIIGSKGPFSLEEIFDRARVHVGEIVLGDLISKEVAKKL